MPGSQPSPSRKAQRGTRWPHAAAADRRATSCVPHPYRGPPMNPAGSSGAMLTEPRGLEVCGIALAIGLAADRVDVVMSVSCEFDRSPVN